MPHMNRIRVVNVAFNDAKSFFDDLRMSLAGKSTTYDLENGGGKTVLLMMLLQTVIPNTSLREDKPLKNIFIGGKDRTSHVLVEWLLDEGMRYKYMLTGFCARKKRSQNEVRLPGFEEIGLNQDEETISQGIDYYNYIIFYDEPVEYDIYSLDLVRENDSGKTYIGYDELRAELGRLRQKGCSIRIFDKKGEYMEYIATQNLIGTEWKIICAMNSGENSIEKYFRENKTSRRLIEKLLLPIIVDTERVRHSERLEESSNVQLADTLLEIRENLARLMKNREHLEEYEQILKFHNQMLEICSRLEEHFQYEERLKRQAVKVRNLLERRLDEMSRMRVELETALTEKTLNNRKTEEEKKLLEIQLLEFDKSRHESEQEKTKEAKERLEEQRREQDYKYREAGAEREYLQYKEARVKRLQAEAGLNALSQSRSELDTAYNEAGCLYRTVLTDRQKMLEDMRGKAAKEKEGLQLDGARIDQEINELSRQLGLAEGDERNESAAVFELEKKIKPLREYFQSMGKPGLDILIGIETFLLESERKLKQLEDKRWEIEASLSDTRQSIEVVISEIEENSRETERLNWKKTPHTDFFKGYEEEKLRLEKKAALYDCEDFIKWKQRLSELIHSNQEIYFGTRVEKDALSRKLEVLETHGFYIPNEEILALSDRLKERSTFTQTGIEWLNRMEKDKQEELLSRAPLLPYSVLVDHNSFRRLKEGKLDFGGFISDYPVPVIDIEFIRGSGSLENEDVIFPEADLDLILSEDALNRYLERLKRDINRLEERMISLEESSGTYNDDLSALSSFEEKYSPDIRAEHERLLKKLEGEILNLGSRAGSLSDRLEELKKAETDLSSDMIKNQEEYRKLLEDQGRAADLHRFNSELEEKKRALEEAKRSKVAINEKLLELNREKQSIRQRRDEIDERILNLTLDISQCKEELSRVAAFEPAGDFGSIDPETAKSRFDALDEQMKGRNRQEEDLRSQINSHENFMAKCKENMEEHYGFTVEMMEEREASGGIISLKSESYVRSIKNNIKALDEEISEKQEALFQMGKEISRLEAKIDIRRQELDDELEIPVNNFEYKHDIEKAIEDAEQILLMYRDEINMLNQELQTLNGKIGDSRMELERYQEFIQKEGIVYITDDTAEEVPDYGEYSSSYYSHVNRFRDWEQNWRRTVRSILEEAEGFYIREPVIQLSNLEIPAALGDCTTMINQLNDSVQMIREKIEKTQEDIEVLQSYQQEFVRRCIQRAENALDLLKKFPALSRIDIEGKRTNMIRMDFEDFDEKEKEMRMENHIQGIIREISEENIKDRMYIAERLSTRELLAQATNMEKASVRLYKVERIAEHSRYLKWENAVGSEGQSNALYFIFAVCLISYIRMLSSVNVSVRTRKVIIADNPFGATSAVYLWEPMFSILRSNDVQLIAPGHNIPRELTSQFEVNYLLNQDILADSRTRVVVKDVRAEEDLDQLNFENVEQLSLI
ncbi:MAG: hypothetical protein ACOX22_06360 [Caldicoprobacterales bacterium]|jgi:hypothetical protein